MNLFNVLQYPHEALKQVAEPVTEFGTEELRSTCSRMVATMQRQGGIGLAGNQVGVLKRIIVINTLGSPGGILAVMINPEILTFGDKLQTNEEGCLSFRGKQMKVMRPDSVSVKYQTVDGQEVTRKFKGITAICVQHEVDHLDGITIAERST